MMTLEFSFACDGHNGECHNQRSGGTFPLISGADEAWRNLRALGWHKTEQDGKTRHLCPNCWTAFLEKRK